MVGILYAALLAIGQSDMKRLVAYTSIAHFGFIGMGIFAFTTQAGTGAVLYMVNHGLATGLLFLVVGMLVSRAAAPADRRLRRRRQAGAGAGRGVPHRRSGLARPARHDPFVSEFLVLIGTFTANKTVAIVATVGIILAAALRAAG